jgi:O-antigen/teichoic acid export membrane protein
VIALTAVEVAVLAPLTLWLVPRHGAVAAAWIWAGINLFNAIAGVQLMHRRILRDRAMSWYSRALLLPALAAFGVIGAAAAWRHTQTGLSQPALLLLFAVALAAGFAAAVVVTPHPRRLAGWLARPILAP